MLAEDGKLAAVGVVVEECGRSTESEERAPGDNSCSTKRDLRRGATSSGSSLDEDATGDFDLGRVERPRHAALCSGLSR